jgi:hypothetical protein
MNGCKVTYRRRASAAERSRPRAVKRCSVVRRSGLAHVSTCRNADSQNFGRVLRVSAYTAVGKRLCGGKRDGTRLLGPDQCSAFDASSQRSVCLFLFNVSSNETALFSRDVWVGHADMTVAFELHYRYFTCHFLDPCKDSATNNKEMIITKWEAILQPRKMLPLVEARNGICIRAKPETFGSYGM